MQSSFTRLFIYSIFSTMVFLPNAISQLGIKHCTNYNKFLNQANRSSLDILVDTIYDSDLIMFDQSIGSDSLNLDSILNLFKLDNETTFVLNDTNRSHLDSNKYFLRYNQFHDNTFVEGGGFVLGISVHGGGSGPDLSDDCSSIISVLPYIATDINTSTLPTLDTSSIRTLLASRKILESRLEIHRNKNNKCDYNLVYVIRYIDSSDANYVAVIDAHNGSVYHNRESGFALQADLVTYGLQDLNDYTDNGVYYMRTPENDIRLFSSNFRPQDNPILPSQWTDLIETTHIDWSLFENEAQTFYVLDRVKKVLTNEGIPIGNINAIHISELLTTDPLFPISELENAIYHTGSTQEEIFMTFGEKDNKPFALYDVAAHELGHSVIHKHIFGASLSKEGGSIHEGGADIIGTYVEYKIQNYPDWEPGDDELTIALTNDRHLQLTQNNCYTDLISEPSWHKRGEALGHWYYLTAMGDPNRNIPAIDLDIPFDIFIESLNYLNVNSDYPDVREHTLRIAENWYGKCSTVYESIDKSWEAICVGVASDPCYYSINGPVSNSVCEEDNIINLCLSGLPTSNTFKWSIKGKKKTQFNINGQTGSSYIQGHGLNCIYISDFPNYPYYPQTINIEGCSYNASGKRICSTYRLTIRDCDGSEPTCEEYYNNSNFISNNSSSVTEKLFQISRDSFSSNHFNNSSINVYNIMGVLIYSGSKNNFSNINLPNTGIYLIEYIENGIRTKIEKQYFNKNI